MLRAATRLRGVVGAHILSECSTSGNVVLSDGIVLSIARFAGGWRGFSSEAEPSQPERSAEERSSMKTSTSQQNTVMNGIFTGYFVTSMAHIACSDHYLPTCSEHPSSAGKPKG